MRRPAVPGSLRCSDDGTSGRAVAARPSGGRPSGGGPSGGGRIRGRAHQGAGHQERSPGTDGGTSGRDESTTPTDALMLDQQLNVVLGMRELPAPQPGQALIRVAWAGVCGSDLHVLKTGAWVAYWPATLGHEVAGVVQECPGDEFAPGTTVVVDSRLPCAKCAGCQTAPSLCERMQWLGEAIPAGSPGTWWCRQPASWCAHRTSNPPWPCWPSPWPSPCMPFRGWAVARAKLFCSVTAPSARSCISN